MSQSKNTLVMALGGLAIVLGLVALLVDFIQGDPFNGAVLVPIAVGVLVLGMAYRKVHRQTDDPAS